ncbi:MAG: hypothetical protein JWM77_2723 [Rhodospirillales bacterium]|nr:hypothetical protein [Rhodospirillales bacterium]
MLGREADSYVRLRMACALLCVLCGAGLVGLSPLLLARAIDRLGTGDLAELGPLLGFYVAIHWLGRSLNEFRLLAYGPAEQRLARRVSERLFDHLLALPLRALRQRQSGSFAQIMANGIAGLRIVLTHVTLTLLPVLVEFATVGLVLIQLGRAEFLPLFGLSVLLYLLAFRFSMGRIVGPSRAMSRAQVEASATLQDLLANGETLKSFAAETYARDRYAAQVQATERAFRRFYVNRAGGGLLVTLVFALSLGSALALAAQEVATGALTVGSFVLINAYMLQIVRPLELVGFAMRDIGQGLAFLEQMDQLFRIARERDAAGPDLPIGPPGAFSREVDTGSRRENAPNQKVGEHGPINLIGSCSAAACW